MPGPLGLPVDLEENGQPVFRAYAETHRGVRFLLPILPSGVAETRLDVDDAGSPREADVVVRTEKTGDPGIRLEIAPVDRKWVSGLDLTVFLAPNVNVAPRLGDDPELMDWTYVRFLGRNDLPDLSQPVPDAFEIELRVELAKDSPEATTTVRLRSGTAVGPLRVQVGTLRAPVVVAEARVVTALGGAYDDSGRESIRAVAPPWDTGVEHYAAPTWQHVDLRLGGEGEQVLMEKDVLLTLTAADTGPVLRPAPPGCALEPGATLGEGEYGYHVTWLLANGAESAASKPLDSPVVVPAGEHRAVRVTLPLPPAEQAPDPRHEIVGRRVYRTRASGGDAFLAHEGDLGETGWLDDVPDSGLGDVLPGRLVAHLEMPVPYDVVADVRDRLAPPLSGKAAHDRVIHAALTGLPQVLDVAYDPRAADPAPRLLWTSSERLGSASVVASNLEGTYHAAAAALTSVPTTTGVDWRLTDGARLSLELCGATRGAPASGGVGAFRFGLGQSEDALVGWPETGVVADVDTRKTRETIRAGATQLRRLSIAVGQPGGVYMRDGAGFAVLAEHADTVDADPPVRPTRPAAERTARIAFVDATSRLVARASELPDDFSLDVGLAGDLGVHTEGAVRDLVLHLQGSNEAVGAAPAASRTWLALPRTPATVDVRLVAGTLHVANSDPVTGDVSLALRPADGPPVDVRARLDLPKEATVQVPGDAPGRVAKAIGPAQFVADPPLSELATGDVVVFTSGANTGRMQRVDKVSGDEVSILTPPHPPAGNDAYVLKRGLRLAAADGVSGRVSVASAPADRKPPTVRANPQVLVSPAGIAARLAGATELVWGGNPVERPLVVALRPDRLNPSARVRLAGAERDTLVLRASRLTDRLDAVLGVAGGVTSYQLSFSERPGSIWLFAEPDQPDPHPQQSPVPVGVGLARADLVGLPAYVKLELDPHPVAPDFWNQVPSHWGSGAVRLRTDGNTDVRWLRIVTRSRDELITPFRVRWSRTDVTGLSIERTTADQSSLALWTFTERSLAEYEEPESGLAFRIGDDLLAWLDMDSYDAETRKQAVHWTELHELWRLRAELQMRGYRGMAMVGPEPPTSAGWGLDPAVEGRGPGDWFLRVLDARKWSFTFSGLGAGGSAYFGNMGWGFPADRATRQRIYA